MEKPWFPQRNPLDTVIALLKSYVFHIQLSISQETIEKDVKDHKEFPYLTIAALKEIIEKWGLETIAGTMDMKEIRELPPFSILFIHDKEGELKVGLFVLLYKAEGDTIEYLHPRKGWVTEDLGIFESKWSKATLVLTGMKENCGEVDYAEKEKAYNERKYKNPELKNIQISDDFLTDEECQHIINISTPLFERSKYMIGDKKVVHEGRTSFSAELHVFPDDEIMNGIRTRASKLLNLPESHFEYFQCVSYDKTQEINSHFDTFDDNSEGGRKIIAEGGQRKYTMLGYLNDDFKGGGTYFPNVDILVQPKKKRVVIFNNLDEQGKVIKTAFHAGLPVKEGRKYAVNMWVRNKPCR